MPPETSTPTEPAMAYIARKKCGCVVMAIVDDPEHAADVAKHISAAIKRGQTIERISVEAVRALKLMGCKCGQKVKP